MPIAMKPAVKGRFDHIAREPRVLADDGAVTVIAAQKMARRGHAYPERRLGGHGFHVGGAADAVGSEQLSGHDIPLGVPRAQPGPGPSPDRLIPKPVCRRNG